MMHDPQASAAPWNRMAATAAAWTERCAAAVDRMPARRFVAALILIELLLHIPVLPLPPMGQHTWRQVMWAAPARNYAEEGSPFFSPQHDVRVAPDDRGYLYHEFPLLFWLMGQSYRVTGEHPINGRLAVFAVASLLLVGGFALMRALGYSERRAKWVCVFLAASPFFFYYSVTLESSLPALAWFVLGLALLVPSLRRGQVGWAFWSGMALVILATLSKQTFLFFGLPVGFLFLYHYLQHRRLALLWGGCGSFAALLAAQAAIYWHTLVLYRQAPVERQVYWEIGPVPLVRTLSEAVYSLTPPVITWVPELFINSAALPFFVAGVLLLFVRPMNSWEQRGFWIAWVASMAVFSLMFMSRLREHEYYLAPVLMVTAMASASGAEWFWQNKRWRWLAVALLVLVPLVMVGRVYARWTVHRQVPEELLTRAEDIVRPIPPDARVIVVGDTSPIVYLYYLHRKGVRVGDDADAEIPRLLANGFRWAVTSKPLGAVPALERLGTVVGQVGRFTVLRMREPGSQ